MSSTASGRRSRSGFTLIELLVVIAIIAILAAILFPVFAAAKQAGLKASCSSNMKQVFTGVTNYCNDYGGKLPPVADGNLTDAIGKTDAPIPLTWPVICKSYFKTFNIVRCPADRLDPGGIYKFEDGNQYNNWINWGRVASPGYNYAYLSPYTSKSGDKPVPVSPSSAASPSKTVMFVESHTNNNNITNNTSAYGFFLIEPPVSRPDDADGTKYTTFGGWNETNAPNGFVYPRHGELANVVWLDGHVNSMRVEKLNDQTLWDLQ